jgi:hypothetical protein
LDDPGGVENSQVVSQEVGVDPEQSVQVQWWAIVQPECIDEPESSLIPEGGMHRGPLRDVHASESIDSIFVESK